jgi:hypothetical protein
MPHSGHFAGTARHASVVEQDHLAVLGQTVGHRLVRIGPNSHRKNHAGRTAVDNDDLETLLGSLPAELGMPPPSINIVVKSSGVTDVLRRTKPSSPHLTPGGRRL